MTPSPLQVCVEVDSVTCRMEESTTSRTVCREEVSSPQQSPSPSYFESPHGDQVEVILKVTTKLAKSGFDGFRSRLGKKDFFFLHL